MKDTGVRNTSRVVEFPLTLLASSDLAAVTFEAGDALISRDGGNFAATTNLPTAVFLADGTTPSGLYKITLTATEWDAERLVLRVVDQTDPKVWKDQTVRLETYGSATAQHQFIPVGAAITFAGPFFRQNVDLDGSTRISVRITDSFGTVPASGEITAGLISVWRRPVGGTNWGTPIVDDDPMQKIAGEIYYDLAVPSASYSAGDELYFVIGGVEVTRNGVSYQMDGGGPAAQYHLSVQGRPVETLSTAALAAINAQCDSALADYDGPTKAELDTAQGVITSAISALNDLSAAQVNAEVDTALADYDGPTRAEMTAEHAALVSEHDTLLSGQTAISAAIAALNNLDSAAVAAAVLGGIVEGTFTLAQVLQVLFASQAGQVTAPTPGAAGSVSVKSPVTPTTTRISASVDAAGQRTLTTVNP